MKIIPWAIKSLPGKICHNFYKLIGFYNGISGFQTEYNYRDKP
jgi:hypothetical protein